MTDPGSFQASVGARAFRASLLRLVASRAAPTRLTLAVFQPLDAANLEAWAELPSWARVAATVPAEAEAALSDSAAVAQDPALGPLFELRLLPRVRNAPAAGALSAELVAPYERTVMIDGRTIRHLGYVNPARRHAKAFKHVLGLAREASWDRHVWHPLTALGGEIQQPDLVSLLRAGCALIERAHELRGMDDFYQDVCADCPRPTVSAIEPALREAGALLQRVAREAIGQGERDATVASFPHGRRGASPGIGVADERGILHLTLRPDPPQGGREVHSAASTYLVSPQRSLRPTPEERRLAAEQKLDETVSREWGATFIRRRDA